MTNKHKAKVKRLVMQGYMNQEIADSMHGADLDGRVMYFYIEKLREGLKDDGKRDPVPRLAKVTAYHEDENDYGKPYEFTGSFSVSETIILNKLNKGFVYEDKRKLSSFERKLNGDLHKYSSNKLV